MDKNLLEKREDGKYRLIENFILLPDAIKKISLKENVQTVEHDGKKFNCVGAYTFPISRPDRENYNERIYTSSLWKKVISEQKEIWDGVFGLCDHPENDNGGSVKDAWCVWHNVRMNEDKSLTLADAYLFGTWGEHAQKALDAGGKLGMSSVGYGDFKADGKTIDENSYEIERPADWVLNPSYGVFGTLEHIVKTNEKKSKEEKITKISILSTKENTNKVEAKQKEKDIMSKQDILLEKNFEWHVKSKLKDIKTIESLQEKLKEYKELLTIFEDVDFADDLKKKVENDRDEVNKQILDLALKGKDFDSVNESKDTLTKEKKELSNKYVKLDGEYKELQEKFDVSVTMLDDLKNYTNKLKDLYDITKAESNGKISATEYRELSVFTEELENKYKILKQEMTKLQQNKHSENTHRSHNYRKSIKRPDTRRKDTSDGDNEKKEYTFNIRNDEEIMSYYEDLYSGDSRVEIIKEDILKCKTLIEAQKTYLHLKSLYEDTPSPYKARINSSDKSYMEEKSKNTPRVSVDRIKRKGWI